MDTERIIGTKKMMKKLICVSLLFVSTPSMLLGQERTPKVQDLDFLTGKWEIKFEIYDTHEPDSEPIFTEKGSQVCGYELKLNEVPMFLTCKGELVIDHTDEKRSRHLGRKREIMETIRYGRFERNFERIGLYSNWPATGLEVLSYDSASRQLTIRGQLNVQGNMLERYIDTYQFNEDYTEAERTNIANFSDMPFTEYNLTLKGYYRKLEE